MKQERNEGGNPRPGACAIRTDGDREDAVFACPVLLVT